MVRTCSENAGRTTVTKSHIFEWPKVERMTKEKQDWRNSRESAEAECTRRSVDGPRKMGDILSNRDKKRNVILTDDAGIRFSLILPRTFSARMLIARSFEIHFYKYIRFRFIIRPFSYSQKKTTNIRIVVLFSILGSGVSFYDRRK